MLCPKAVQDGLLFPLSEYIPVTKGSWHTKLGHPFGLSLSVQMPHHSSTFKGTTVWTSYLCWTIHQLPPFRIHIHKYLYTKDTNISPTHMATSTYTGRMSFSCQSMRGNSLNPWHLTGQLLTVGWFHQLQSQNEVPRKGVWAWNVSECRPSFWGTHSCKNCPGLVGAGVGGDRVRVGSLVFSFSIYLPESIYQLKDSH